MQKHSKTAVLIIFLLIASSVRGGEWVPQATGSLSWFRTINFSDSETGWIGGSKGAFLKTVDGGKTWNSQRKFTLDTIRKIHFTDTLNGWALCERDIYSLGTKDPSYLMGTRNGGRSWDTVELKNSNRRRIVNLTFSKNGFVLALGEMGTMYGLKDDRRTWERIATPTSFLMLDAAFADDFSGAIVGGGGTILFTEDAGITWSPAVLSKRTRSMLRAVHFATSREGWIVGTKGKVYQTINGGKYWRVQKSNTAADLNGVYFKDNANGWAIGNQGVILHTSTGGNIWTQVRSSSRNNLEEIYFNGSQGWIVGFGGTLLKLEEGLDPNRRPVLRRPSELGVPIQK